MLLISSMLNNEEINSPEDVESYKNNIQSLIKGTKEMIKDIVEKEDYELDELDLLTIQLYSSYIRTLEKRYEGLYSRYPDIMVNGNMVSSIKYILENEA